MAQNRRAIVLLIICGLIAVGFWTSSRYPALSNKAAMSGTEAFEDRLTHQAHFHVPPGATLTTRILYTTLNWYETNMRGMAFGLVMAGGFLALLSHLPKKPSRNRFKNSLLGMLVGTPLGVCVNCVAPIAKGIYDAGSRMETALAVLFSSPTLNIVVLTMLFSIFPFYMAALKVATTFVLVLLIVPLISHKVPLKTETVPADASLPDAECEITSPMEPWARAFSGALKDFWKSFLYIFIRTFPLMLLAGFLGAALSHLMSFERFIGWPPDWGSLSLVAFLGTFMPLPIAFDLMLTQALMMSKLADGFVMTLLFTLGTFSIYSAMVVYRTFSLWMAVKLYVIVMALGIGAGWVADSYSQHRHLAWLEQFDAYAQVEAPKQDDLKKWETENATPLRFLATDVVEWKPLRQTSNLRIDYALHGQRNTGSLPFTKKLGPDWGIDYSNQLTPRNFFDPFFFGRGIASGDLDADGWTDVVIATDRGIRVYQNVDGKEFHRVTLPQGDLAGKEVLNVAMVDLNNDGWLDIFAATFEEGNYAWIHPGTDRDAPHVIPVPNDGALLTNSMAFADVNGDGWPDIVNGNYFLGVLTRTPNDKSFDQLVMNRNLKFELKPLGGIPGQTQTSLFSDFNNDGVLDLMIGNDYRVSDTYFLGSPEGDFKKIKRGDGLFSITTENTMSMDTGDWNNDLVPDLYLANIGFSKGIDVVSNIFGTFMQEEGRKFCDSKTTVLEPEACRETVKMVTLLNPEKQDISERCDVLGSPQAIGDCMVTRMALYAIEKEKPELCTRLDKGHAFGRKLCTRYFESKRLELDRSEEIPIRSMSNIFFQGGQGGFEDRSQELGVTTAEWSWTARFADLDNDEWQDLYVVNGVLITQEFATNNFFHNEGGKAFSEKQKEFGLEDIDHSSAYTYIDIDNDGDLDIITNTQYGPFKVYRNNNETGNSVTLRLRDPKGNRFCIGCRVTIHYGAQGERHQMREIKTSGGFRSFDAPVLHFGLGSHDHISKIEIRWTDSTTQTLTQSFPANRDYLISRY